MELNLDTFGEIMDKFIHENEIALLVSKEAMTDDWRVRENTGCGPVMQLHILLNALSVVLTDMLRLLDMDMGIEDFIGGLLELVKNDIMARIRPEEGTADAAE